MNISETDGLSPGSLSCLPVCPRFHEDDHNCFTFCLQFMNSVLAAEGRSSLSKDAFTQSFILPRMKRVSKYTTLYQHIQKHQYYVVDRQEDTAAEPEEDHVN